LRQRGSWVWTTKVLPPDLARTRADSGRVARPVAIHRSGQASPATGSTASDDGSSIHGAFSADGSLSKALRQRTRLTVMRDEKRRWMASARPSA